MNLNSIQIHPEDAKLGLHHLQFGTPALNALQGVGITTVGALINRLQDEPALIERIGSAAPVAVEQFMTFLAEGLLMDGQIDWDSYRRQVGVRINHLCLTSPSLRRLHPDCRQMPTSTLHLDKALRALEEAAISTVGQLVDALAAGLPKLRSFGLKAKTEVVDAVVTLSHSINRQGAVDWENFAQARGLEMLPHQNAVGTGAEFLSNLPALCEQAVKAQFDDREFLIFKKRVLAPAQEQPVLENVGELFGVCRERIRQLEAQAIAMLRESMLRDEYTGCKFRWHCGIFAPLHELSTHLACIDVPVLSLAHWHEEIASFWSAPVAMVEHWSDLLAALLGYERRNLKSPGFESVMVRGDLGRVEITRILTGIEQVHRVLRDGVRPADVFDLAIAVNKSTGNTYRLAEMPALVEACSSVERLEGSLVQLLFDRLSRPDQAFRILHENGEALHFREIAAEINRRCAKDDQIAEQSLSNQLSNDSRFSPIGKTGLWTVREWGDETRTIKALILELLKRANGPMTEEDIFRHVAGLRPVSPNSVKMILRDATSQFALVRAGQWSLAEPTGLDSRWGNLAA